MEAPPEALSRALCGTERGWGTGRKNDLRAPLAGRKNLSNGASDNHPINPLYFPSRNAFSPHPVTLLASRMSGAQLQRLDSRSDIGTLEIFLAAEAPSQGLFSARVAGIFPSARHRRGRSV